MQFIPCVEPKPNEQDKPAPSSVKAEKYGDFLMPLWELWKADFRAGKPTTYVRNFESLLFTYAEPHNRSL